MSGAAPVVVAGHVCLDVTPVLPAGALGAARPGALVEVGGAAFSAGGAVGNTGVALARLGVPVRLVAKVGADLFGRGVADALGATGAEVRLVTAPDAQTSYSVVLSPPGRDRTFLHCPGANDTFGPAEVTDDALSGAGWLHWGYPPLMAETYRDGGAALAALFTRARSAGLGVSLDMAWVDPAGPAAGVDWPAWLGAVLPHVDVFGPSLGEVAAMLGRDVPADGPALSALAGDLLALGSGAVLLKLGEGGLYLRTVPDVDRLGWPARPEAWAGRELLAPCFVVEEAGTTGSGDATFAGFLDAVRDGAAPEVAVTHAVAVGASSVERAGGAAALPPSSAVRSRVLSGWPRRPTRLPLPGWTSAYGAWAGPAETPLRPARP